MNAIFRVIAVIALIIKTKHIKGRAKAPWVLKTYARITDDYWNQKAKCRLHNYSFPEEICNENKNKEKRVGGAFRRHLAHPHRGSALNICTNKFL